MTIQQLLGLLGKTYEDKEVQAFVQECGITKKPRIPRGEWYVILEARKAGLSITFYDEEHLGPKFKYQEGALVVRAITLESGRETTYKRYTGELPNGLSFENGKKEITAKLGKPAWASKHVANIRWDLKGYNLLVEFERDLKISRSFNLQLPGVD